MVYEKLKTLEFFNQFSVWGKRDSSVVNTISGNDGQIGSVSHWNGDPRISGKGTVRLSALEPGRKVEQAIEFMEPKKGRAQSIFTLSEKDRMTTVTWRFVMRTPRPWNIFNLFFSLEKQVGPDFDESLATLKQLVDGTETKANKETAVKLLDFPATDYAVIRQKVNWPDIMAFYSRHWEMLSVELQSIHLTPSNKTGLVFEWDEKNRTAVLGAAIPVPAGTSIDNPIISIESMPASKAIYLDHTGPGDRVFENFPSLQKYLNDNGLKEIGPRIIQFARGNDSTVTRMIFLVD